MFGSNKPLKEQGNIEFVNLPYGLYKAQAVLTVDTNDKWKIKATIVEELNLDENSKAIYMEKSKGKPTAGSTITIANYDLNDKRDEENFGNKLAAASLKKLILSVCATQTAEKKDPLTVLNEPVAWFLAEADKPFDVNIELKAGGKVKDKPGEFYTQADIDIPEDLVKLIEEAK